MAVYDYESGTIGSIDLLIASRHGLYTHDTGFTLPSLILFFMLLLPSAGRWRMGTDFLRFHRGKGFAAIWVGWGWRGEPDVDSQLHSSHCCSRS